MRSGFNVSFTPIVLAVSACCIGFFDVGATQAGELTATSPQVRTASAYQPQTTCSHSYLGPLPRAERTIDRTAELRNRDFSWAGLNAKFGFRDDDDIYERSYRDHRLSVLSRYAFLRADSLLLFRLVTSWRQLFDARSQVSIDEPDISLTLGEETARNLVRLWQLQNDDALLLEAVSIAGKTLEILKNDPTDRETPLLLFPGPKFSERDLRRNWLLRYQAQALSLLGQKRMDPAFIERAETLYERAWKPWRSYYEDVYTKQTREERVVPYAYRTAVRPYLRYLLDRGSVRLRQSLVDHSIETVDLAINGLTTVLEKLPDPCADRDLRSDTEYFLGLAYFAKYRLLSDDSKTDTDASRTLQKAETALEKSFSARRFEDVPVLWAQSKRALSAVREHLPKREWSTVFDRENEANTYERQQVIKALQDAEIFGVLDRKY